MGSRKTSVSWCLSLRAECDPYRRFCFVQRTPLCSIYFRYKKKKERRKYVDFVSQPAFSTDLTCNMYILSVNCIKIRPAVCTDPVCKVYRPSLHCAQTQSSMCTNQPCSMYKPTLQYVHTQLSVCQTSVQCVQARVQCIQAHTEVFMDAACSVYRPSLQCFKTKTTLWTEKQMQYIYTHLAGSVPSTRLPCLQTQVAVCIAQYLSVYRSSMQCAQTLYAVFKTQPTMCTDQDCSVYKASRQCIQT